MNLTDLQVLIADHLETMADQVALLYTQGLPEEAELLRNEGLKIAEAYDNEEPFFVLSDFTTI